jgi:hypothetical protein
MKKYGAGILVATLLLLTFATLPRIDYVEPDIFLYLNNLPVIYYVSLITSIIVALISQNRFIRIFSVIAFTLLIMLTPSVMFTNPWHMDSYPFTGEGVYVQINSELGNAHYLSESPALGLVLGSFLMITGINPLVLMRIYPSIVAIICVLIVYSLAEKLKIDKKSAVFAPLCLVAIMWPNAFHVSRQSFALLYYLASWLCLFMLILNPKDRKISLILVIQLILIVITHPATPIFFMTNLVAVIIVGGIFRKLGRREIKLIAGTLGLCAFTWILWNY